MLCKVGSDYCVLDNPIFCIILKVYYYKVAKSDTVSLGSQLWQLKLYGNAFSRVQNHERGV